MVGLSLLAAKLLSCARRLGMQCKTRRTWLDAVGATVLHVSHKNPYSVQVVPPRRGGGEVGGLGLHRRRGGGVIGGIGGFSVRVGKRIGGSALRTSVGGCCMGILCFLDCPGGPEMAFEFGQPVMASGVL